MTDDSTASPPDTDEPSPAASTEEAAAPTDNTSATDAVELAPGTRVVDIGRDGSTAPAATPPDDSTVPRSASASTVDERPSEEVTLAEARDEVERKLAATDEPYPAAVATARESLKEDVIALSEDVATAENERDRFEQEREQYADARDELEAALDEERVESDAFRLTLKGGLSRRLRPEDAADLLDQYEARVEYYAEQVEDAERQIEKTDRAREKAALTHGLVVRRDQALTTLANIPDLLGDPDVDPDGVRSVVDEAVRQATGETLQSPMEDN